MADQTLDQLKSRAYDLIALRERADQELRQINDAIANHSDNSPAPPEPQDHKKKASKS